MITVGELRKLIEGKPDAEEIPLHVKYGDVCHEYIFVRLDQLSTIKPDGALVAVGDPPGLYLTISLVGADDFPDVDDESYKEA